MQSTASSSKNRSVKNGYDASDMLRLAEGKISINPPASLAGVLDILPDKMQFPCLYELASQFAQTQYEIARLIALELLQIYSREKILYCLQLGGVAELVEIAKCHSDIVRDCTMQSLLPSMPLEFARFSSADQPCDSVGLPRVVPTFDNPSERRRMSPPKGTRHCIHIKRRRYRINHKKVSYDPQP